MAKNKNNKKKQKVSSVKIDKTSRRAFKITAKVSKPILQTLREVRAGVNV